MACTDDDGSAISSIGNNVYCTSGGGNSASRVNDGSTSDGSSCASRINDGSICGCASINNDDCACASRIDVDSPPGSVNFDGCAFGCAFGISFGSIADVATSASK